MNNKEIINEMVRDFSSPYNTFSKSEVRKRIMEYGQDEYDRGSAEATEVANENIARAVKAERQRVVEEIEYMGTPPLKSIKHQELRGL